MQKSIIRFRSQSRSTLGLLNGGLGWNSNRWGPACFSIEAAKVVTADGSMLIANYEQHASLPWAIRGAGPGFFAVAIQYFLKLYEAPHAITTSTYYYPLQRIEEVGAWAGSVARQMPSEVELKIFIAPTPPISPSNAAPAMAL